MIRAMILTPFAAIYHEQQPPYARQVKGILHAFMIHTEEQLASKPPEASDEHPQRVQQTVGKLGRRT